MRTLFIFAILFISAFAHHHHHHHLRHDFMGRFGKWKNFMRPKERKSIGHSYAEIANYVNGLKTTWKATAYERNYTPLLGAILDGGVTLPQKKFENTNVNLPDSFDPRDEYPQCESIKEIRDQANCGSCWAFGAAEAMSDRICIQSGQKLQTRVSAQNILTCCSSCGFGCDGGYPQNAWRYWASTGVCTGGLYGDTTTCQPYFLPECDHHVEGSHGPCPDTVDTPRCKRDCEDGNKKQYSDEMTYGQNAYSVSGETNIMQELYEHGPVEASFTVYEDSLTNLEFINISLDLPSVDMLLK